MDYFPKIMPYLFWALLVAGLIVWYRLSRRKTFERAFSGRDRLDNHEFYEKYFQAHGVPEEIACKVREILERVLDADLSRLGAEDDFTTNMKFFFDNDSLADLNIIVELEKEFDIKIVEAEAERTHTVADIVDLVWKKTREGSVLHNSQETQRGGP